MLRYLFGPNGVVYFNYALIPFAVVSIVTYTGGDRRAYTDVRLFGLRVARFPAKN